MPDRGQTVAGRRECSILGHKNHQKWDIHSMMRKFRLQLFLCGKYYFVKVYVFVISTNIRVCGGKPKRPIINVCAQLYQMQVSRKLNQSKRRLPGRWSWRSGRRWGSRSGEGDTCWSGSSPSSPRCERGQSRGQNWGHF